MTKIGTTEWDVLVDLYDLEWKLTSELQAPNSGPRYQVWERA